MKKLLENITRFKIYKSQLKKLLGILLIVGGVVFGAYLGLYVCFVGGIVNIIDVINEAARHNVDIDSAKIAFGVVKIVFAGLVFWFSTFIGILPGLILFKES